MTSKEKPNTPISPERVSALAGAVGAAAAIPGGIFIAPLTTIIAALATSQSEVKEAESRGLPDLAAEAKKQQVLMEFQAHQARVAQEIAIAQRIALSNEVEIEEYYDTTGKGHAGFSSTKESINIGVGAEGRKVTKRIIKFTGWNSTVEAPTDG